MKPDNVRAIDSERLSYSNTKIFIDPGHGSDTPGKRSPDGRFLEYKFNREIAGRIVADLQDCGYDAELLVPEETDIPLKERCQRVNNWCQVHGKQNAICISIHVNASASDGQWHKAIGWCAYTTPGITKSDILAYDLYKAAQLHLPNQKIRLINGPKEPDFEENFYLLRHTKCAAVITESFFYDNKNDLVFLESLEDRNAIVKTHTNGITAYLAAITSKQTKNI